MSVFRRKPESSEDRDRFIEAARSHVGYRTRPSGLSEFGALTGYSGHAIPWSGAFIDVVARQADVFMPACTYTPSGLAEFTHGRRVVLEPLPGDVVFYAFPTAEQFSMPHCGIVIDVTDIARTDEFVAIEAQVNSGLPRGSQSADGVFERRRWRYDVLAFARPDFSRRPGRELKNADGSDFVRPARVKPGRRGSDVQLVQIALERVAGLHSYSPGVFDDSTRRAYARWQRQHGVVYPDCTGEPDHDGLALLGRVTGLFAIKTSDSES